MATFEPRDPDFAARVQASFARQTIMNIRSKSHEQTIALMQATMMTIESHAGIHD